MPLRADARVQDQARRVGVAAPDARHGAAPYGAPAAGPATAAQQAQGELLFTFNYLWRSD